MMCQISRQPLQTRHSRARGSRCAWSRGRTTGYDAGRSIPQIFDAFRWIPGAAKSANTSTPGRQPRRLLSSHVYPKTAGTHRAPWPRYPDPDLVAGTLADSTFCHGASRRFLLPRSRSYPRNPRLAWLRGKGDGNGPTDGPPVSKGDSAPTSVTLRCGSSRPIAGTGPTDKKGVGYRTPASVPAER